MSGENISQDSSLGPIFKAPEFVDTVMLKKNSGKSKLRAGENRILDPSRLFGHEKAQKGQILQATDPFGCAQDKFQRFNHELTRIGHGLTRMNTDS